MKLRSFPLLIGLTSVLALTAAEQQVGEVRLDSDQGDFALRDGYYHFSGNVRFRYPGVMDLDCDDLMIRVQPGGNQIDRLIASNKVVLTIVENSGTNAPAPIQGGGGATNKIYAALAVYTGTNDLVTLTGSPTTGQPWVERKEGSFKADSITFDRANERIRGLGHFQMIHKAALGLPSRALKTPPAAKPTP